MLCPQTMASEFWTRRRKLMGETRHLPGSGGIDICAEVTGSGSPLVLVHGTSGDRSRWQPVTPYLAPHFTCYALDRRGRGDSGKDPDYAIEQEFQDIAAIVDQLAGEAGGPVHVFGHSYGALASLQATRLTGNIARLAIYEPPIPGDAPITPPEVMATLLAHADAGDREAVMETFALQVVRYSADEYALIKSLPTWPNRLAAALTIPRELGALNNGYRFDPGAFDGYDVPTLMLLGTDSPDFLRNATFRLREVLPNADLHEMPGQQHNAIDQIPEDLAERVRTFLLG